MSKSWEIFTGLTYKALSSLMAISDSYRCLIQNKTTKNCLTQWISSLPVSFEIHRVRYLVNFTGLAGIINAPVYKTEPIFTGLGHGKLSWFLTLLLLTPCEAVPNLWANGSPAFIWKLHYHLLAKGKSINTVTHDWMLRCSNLGLSHDNCFVIFS